MCKAIHLMKHVLTACVGKGVPLTHRPCTGNSKNEDIWDRNVYYSKHEVGLSRGNAANTCSVAVEAKRSASMAKLRKKFETLCKEEGILPPVVAFERWISNCLLVDKTDPILPSDNNFIEPGLVDDLKAASISGDQALRVVRELAQFSSTLVVTLHSKTNNPTVQVVRHKHTYDVLLTGSKNILKINNMHYKKLVELHGRYGKADFEDCLFNVLSRYNSLLGHGMHCALSEHVFACMLDHLKVNFECFASPLNCRYSSYCSMFGDTDSCFGSLGSFFDFYPKRGSFEANPPFIPSIMLAMAHHILALLDSNEPLSFVVILPGWLELESWKILLESKYKQSYLVVAASDHGYCSGAQHQRKDRYIQAGYDSGVFVLQNVPGSIEFCFKEDAFQKDLRHSFALSVPTEAMKQRHEKEDRGSVFQKLSKKRKSDGNSKKRMKRGPSYTLKI